MTDTPDFSASLPDQTVPSDRLPIFFAQITLFAAFILLGLALWLHNVAAGKRFEEYAADQINMLGKLAQPGDVTMVMLGDSRSRYAWRYGDDPAKTTPLPDGRTLRSVKISHDSAVFGNFDELGGPLHDSHPDIVIIQQSLLIRPSAPVSALAQLRKLPYIVAYKAVLSGQPAEAEWLHYHEDRTCPHKYTLHDFKGRMHSQTLVGPPDFGPEMQETARSIIQPLLDDGARVIILHIPPNAPYAKELGINPVALDNIFLSAIPPREKLLPAELRDRVTWMDYKGPDRKSAYCDDVHMDQKSSEDFAAWLKGEIVRNYP